MTNPGCRKIRIRELKVFANHGVYEAETRRGQNFYINAELTLDADAQNVLSDDIEETVNYAEVCEFINEYFKENTCKLIERITELLCMELMYRYPLINAVQIEVRKPEAPIEIPFESVSVVREMSRHTVLLSIGSNIGDKHEHLDRAIELLDTAKHTRVICESERFVTKPYGGVEQDDFVNSAVLLETVLSPHALLDFLHEIESDEGRTREIHWGPRTLDLDIIFYDDLVLSDSKLTIPHADMQNREFVLEPLSKIAGYYRHPVLNKTVSQLYEELKVREEA